MTLKQLLEQLNFHYDGCANENCENLNSELLELELQFHYNCIWYHVDKLDRVDQKNQRIILECEFKNKPTSETI